MSSKGIAADPAKIQKVVDWPVPVNKREVQQFLGLISYYRRFIKDCSSVAKPLYQLIERSKPFYWTTECDQAFKRLREYLTAPPVLIFPDFSKEFLLDTDASDQGIGAVLSQIQSDGQERVVAYASRLLSKSERRYCVTRKELLAVVVFLHHFRQSTIPFFIKNLKNPPNNFNIGTYISFSVGNTRSCGVKLRHNASSTNKERHFYFNRISRLWNSLPIIDLNLSFNIIIKRKIKSYILLQTLIQTTYINYIIFVLVAPVYFRILQAITITCDT